MHACMYVCVCGYISMIKQGRSTRTGFASHTLSSLPQIAFPLGFGLLLGPGPPRLAAHTSRSLAQITFPVRFGTTSRPRIAQIGRAHFPSLPKIAFLLGFGATSRPRSAQIGRAHFPSLPKSLSCSGLGPLLGPGPPTQALGAAPDYPQKHLEPPRAGHRGPRSRPG